MNDLTRAILRLPVNSFSLFYRDAEEFNRIAHANRTGWVGSSATATCRSAVLLYVFSLEGLINRAMKDFLRPLARDFFLQREDRLRLEDKWLLVPLNANGSEPERTFDTTRYPWTHFVELVKLRNDLVHPKHDWNAYFRIWGESNPPLFEPLPWNEVPPGASIQEKHLVYRQTQIPKNPFAWMPEHVDVAKRIVDDMINELDRLLSGRVRGEWLESDDAANLVWPELDESLGDAEDG